MLCIVKGDVAAPKPSSTPAVNETPGTVDRLRGLGTGFDGYRTESESAGARDLPGSEEMLSDD
jgi:hypothetical protein